MQTSCLGGVAFHETVSYPPKIPPNRACGRTRDQASYIDGPPWTFWKALNSSSYSRNSFPPIPDSSMTDCCGTVLLYHLLTKGLSNIKMASTKMCMAQNRSSWAKLLPMKTPTQAMAARCEVDRGQTNITLDTFSHFSGSCQGCARCDPPDSSGTAS